VRQRGNGNGAGAGERVTFYWFVMPSKLEIEIKFKIENIKILTAQIKALGFRLVTKRTHEMNTLYDRPGQPLRRRGALLRVRKYGQKWTVTYKDKGKQGRHKSRREIETPVEQGQALVKILQEIGFKPGFSYEKYRTEWADETGHVVIDETPVGNFGEIEGPPKWIDAVARRLEISREQYITASYADLFMQWKRAKRSSASQMLFNR
jgi:adenylate cyclase class 2